MSDTFEQPPPKEGRENVTPIAKRVFEMMLEHQAAKGLEKYGTPLQTHNGRDPYKDALGELVDAVQYLCQAKIEHATLHQKYGELKRSRSRVWVVLCPITREIDSLWATQELAEARCAALNSTGGVVWRVREWKVYFGEEEVRFGEEEQDG